MAYNKAKAERKWRLWKDAEEKKMRDLGVSEDIIERLRTHDWDVFKSERRYYEKRQETGTYLNGIPITSPPEETRNIHDLLNSIDNVTLYNELLTTDKLTLKIIMLKMEGYSSAEIAERCGLSVNAINFRMWHLRKKIKNIL